nr:putative Nudix hydrolase YfcD [Candidatus Pantoea persica]
MLFAGERFAPMSAAAQQAAEKLVAACLRLLLDKQQNLFGEWSLADTNLAVMLNRLALHGDALPGRVREYTEFQWQRASVQLWLAESGKQR